MQINSYDFIWSCFTAEDLQNIVVDSNRIADKFVPLYVLDTYDIVENFLPYTEHDLFSKDGVAIAQKFICYDYLFGKTNTTQIILANEYQAELLAVKSRLQRQLKKVKAVYSNLKKLKEFTSNFDNEERVREFLFKHFEIILLLLIINNKKGSIFDEFLSFARNRLEVAEIKTVTSDQRKVNEIFNQKRPGHVSIEVFKRFVDKRKLDLVSIKNRTERHLFLENTFRDIQVIDRIIQINDAFGASGLKYFVLYLSSARKTDAIMQLFREVTNQDVRFHRNVYQYFLEEKLRAEFEDSPGKVVDILSALQGVRHKAERTQGYEVFDLPDIGKSIIASFSDTSSRIENNIYLSIYKKYNFSGTGDSSKTSPLSAQDIATILKEIDDNQSTLVSKTSDLANNLDHLSRAFDDLNESPKLTRRASKDVIQNAYQHIPILIFLQSYHEEEWNWELSEITNGLIELGKLKSEVRAELIKSLLGKINHVVKKVSNPRSVTESSRREIILGYLSFTGNHVLEEEEDLIVKFESQLEIFRMQNMSIDLDTVETNRKVNFKIEHSILEAELSYLLIWLYRRNKRVDDGIALGEEYLKIFPDDPRLAHGVGLCHLVKGYEAIKSGVASYAQYELATKYLINAHEKYQFVLTSTNNYVTKELIIKVQTAILNSLANIKLRRFDVGTGKPELLFEAKLLVDKIKDLFSEINLSFEDHATYLGTEIEIRYNLAKYYVSLNNLSEGRLEITDASTKLTKLKGMQDYQFSNDFFKEWFRKVPQLMSELMLMK